jgi:hypothetical protein
LFEDLIGKEYESNAKGPDTFNCYGLCIEIYKRMGKDLKEYVSIDDPSIVGDLINQEKINFIEISHPEPYCFVLIKIHPKYTTHIGIVLSDCKSFIHARSKKGVTIEKLNNLIWKNRIQGYFKYV